MATSLLTLCTVLSLATPTFAAFGLPDMITPDLSLKTIIGIGMKTTGMTDTLKQIEQSLQDTHKEIFDTVDSVTNQASQAFSSRYNFIMNVVDEHALMGAFAELIPEAREKGYGNNTCIEGIKVTKNSAGTLILKHGSLSYTDPMNLIAELKEERGEEQLFNSSFTFPDILVHFTWNFQSSVFPYFEREGVMTVVQKSPNRVTVSATAPKSRDVLDEIRNRHECFLKVEAFEVVLGEKLEVREVTYESTLRSMGISQGGAEYQVRNMISDMSGEIMSQLKKTLKSVVAPLTTKPDVFCENSFTTVDPINCENIRWIGEY